MELLEFKENEDGSATFRIDFTQKECEMLLEYAVIDIIKKQIERYRDELTETS
jgi:hypothetical protein